MRTPTTRLIRPLTLLLLALSLFACGKPPSSDELGSLALDLTSEAGGRHYHLQKARFMLEGPEVKGVTSGDEELLEVELTAGTYTLTLLDGWSLEEVSGGTGKSVRAKLLSENPMAIIIDPGMTTEAALRFELGAEAAKSAARGKLSIGVSVAQGSSGPDSVECLGGLRIDELDYDQPGSDTREFVEVVNTAGCAEALEDVVLELVNGGDGHAYARYPLDSAAKTLAGHARLVVGSAAVLATLGSATKSLKLMGSGLQNGPDAVRLVRGEQVLDAVSYQGKVAGAAEGAPALEDRGAQALARCPSGFDSDDNALDFSLREPTPGAANACE